MEWFPEQIAGRIEFDRSKDVIGGESIYRHAYSLTGHRSLSARRRRILHTEFSHWLWGSQAVRG